MADKQTIVDLLTAFFSGGIISAIVRFFTDKKKNDAQMSLIDAQKNSILTRDAIDFVKELRQSASDLKDQVTTLESKIQVLEDHINLQMQIIFKFRSALKGYNPEHPLLQENLPEMPV